MKKLDFLIIDPQNDFCKKDTGSLFVPGADEDMERLAKTIMRLGKKINDIHVTLDTHHVMDIAHPKMWIDKKGKNPNPFTLISVEDVKNGTWRPFNNGYYDRVLSYVETLETNKRYALVIWPEHCLIGTPGHNVYWDVSQALMNWERSENAIIDYVTKGSNPWTEHYSGVVADVPDPSDTTTQMNDKLIEVLNEADLIAIAGEASSHCVANTVRDIAGKFGDESLKKLILVTDCMSAVPGFEKLADDFFADMRAKKVNFCKSNEIENFL